jgi:hypothetical protein
MKGSFPIKKYFVVKSSDFRGWDYSVGRASKGAL